MSDSEDEGDGRRDRRSYKEPVAGASGTLDAGGDLIMDE